MNIAPTISTMRRDAFKIFQSGLDAADPEQAVERVLQLSDSTLWVNREVRIDLANYDRLVVVGAGKASAPMALALEEIFGDRISHGLVSLKYGHGVPLRRIGIVEAGHPLPDHHGHEAALKILRLLEPLGERDLVLSCISGGGSALLPAPVPGVSLEDKQKLTRKLLEVGASIHEINAVRKHLSQVKGGNLMRAAYPAFVVNLMLSDVVGDDPGTIASGPFAPDLTTFGNVLEILEHYRLTEDVSPHIMTRVSDGIEGKLPETPKQGDAMFSNLLNVIVGSNIQSLEAGKKKAEDLGYRTMILSSSIEGDTEESAHFHCAVAEEIRRSGNPLLPPACVLSGGETTVVLRGDGVGGRNQHFALSMVRKVSEIPGSVFLSVGTDGTDGPTDAAGALVDNTTLSRCQNIGLDPEEFLRNSDSYHFFKQLGDLAITGPTRTNVMDVKIMLFGASAS